MDPRQGKATRTPKKVEAAAPKGSAPSAGGALEKSDKSSPASGAAQSSRERCGRAGKSESLRRKSAPGPQERPQGARSKKAPLCAGDTEPLGAATCVCLEGEKPSAPLRAPVPGGGSRCEEDAESAREQRSAPGPKELRIPRSLVPAPNLGRRESADGAYIKLRAVLEKLKLRRQEITSAAEIVNGVVDCLLRRLQSCESAFKGISQLRTGSYYERVKISAPNEFDIMFKLDGYRIQLEEYGDSGAFYFVKFRRNPNGNPLNQFLEKEVLSASKVLTKFRTIIKEEIKNIKDIDIVLERKKRGSPAVTLLIRKPKEISVDVILALESKSSWPVSTQEGLPIHNWLGTKVRTELRRQPYYLVPKNAKEGNDFQEETWRLSFSNIEKDILNNHGKSKTCCENNGVKCCRKSCLKLMKYLLEQLKKKFENRKELNKFCSYHVKTAFFHVCALVPNDSQWHPENLVECFDNCVTYFLQCLRTEQLRHYFIPGFNLFSPDEVNKISKEFLSRQIEYERNNGFPVFGEF